MSVVARLEVIPHREGSMSGAVASALEALDEFDVSYETTPTDTVIEADDAGEVFAAAEAAHRAVSDDRVITSLEVDDLRTRTQRGRERVRSVERQLGRRAKRERRWTSRRRRRTEGRGERKERENQGRERRASHEERPSARGRPRVEQTASGETAEEPTVAEKTAGEGTAVGEWPTEEGGAERGGERRTDRPPRYGGPRRESRREGPRSAWREGPRSARREGRQPTTQEGPQSARREDPQPPQREEPQSSGTQSRYLRGKPRGQR